MSKLFWAILAIAVAALIGIFLLFNKSATPSGQAPKLFQSYARELSLDIEKFNADYNRSSTADRINSDLDRGTKAGVNATPGLFINGKKLEQNPRDYVSLKGLIEHALSSGEADKTDTQPNDHIRTGADAKVTLLEYGDFQCPACGSFYPLLKQLEAEYGERVRVIFRHFPLTNSHPNAFAGARAAEAAGAQGKFFEMHDLLYERQDAWTKNPNAG